MYVLTCDGDLTAGSATPQCSGSWTLVQMPEPFDPSQLDVSLLGWMFGAGFTLVAGPLVFSIGIRAFLDFIKRA